MNKYYCKTCKTEVKDFSHSICFAEGVVSIIEKKDDIVNRCPDCGQPISKCECYEDIED